MPRFALQVAILVHPAIVICPLQEGTRFSDPALDFGFEDAQPSEWQNRESTRRQIRVRRLLLELDY